MTRRTYTPEYKAKLVIEVLQGEKELNTIAAENGISPNMLRNWKAEFLENAGRAFDSNRQAKEARRKEADLKKIQAQMLKTIGQLTLERDFLQGCFREAGWEFIDTAIRMLTESGTMFTVIGWLPPTRFLKEASQI